MFLQLLAASLLWAQAASASEFALVENNLPAAEFLLSGQLPDTVRNDIADFNGELKKITSAVLPSVQKKSGKRNVIELVCVPAGSGDEDRFTFEFPNPTTLRIIGTERSFWWAFRHILVKYGKITYLHRGNTPEWTDYPETPTLKLPAKKFSYTPSLPHLRLIHGNLLYARRHTWIKGERSYMHNFPTEIFPAKKYAPDRWPAAIMPVIKGKKQLTTIPYSKVNIKKRDFQKWAPCYSAPETVDEAVKNIEELLAREPSRKRIGLFPGDGCWQCECPACRAVVKGKHNSIGAPHYSDLYYKWANQVAERITRKHPGIVFLTGTYLDLTDPPSFKLHKNLLPIICFEAWNTFLDEPTRKKREKLIVSWTEKASMFGLHDYCFGLRECAIPRIFFPAAAAYYRKLHSMGLRAADPEIGSFSPLEGPKERFYDALFWDINTDPDEFLKNWCEKAVGKEAGKELFQFFEFWQKYWERPALKKTAWFRSVGNIYMSTGDRTCLNALEPGEIARLEKIMEQVCRKANTSMGKHRAALLMQSFQIMKQLLTLYLSEVLPPDGTFRTPEEARAAVKQLPAAVKTLPELKKIPRIDLYGGDGYFNTFLQNISPIARFADHPEVKKELLQLLQTPSLPAMLRAQIMVWTGYAGKNLLAYGDFEDEKFFRNLGSKYQVQLAENPVFKGKKSLLLKHNGRTVLKEASIVPGKNYCFSFRIFLSKPMDKGKIIFYLIPFSSENGQSFKWWNFEIGQVEAGKWVYCSASFHAPENRIYNLNADSIRIWFEMKNFARNAAAYVDDMQLICLDDIPLKDSVRP